MIKRAALILAGGKARRFQQNQGEWQDKALALLKGKPLLVHAVKNAREAVDQVVVCVNDQTRAAKYTEVLESHGLGDVEFTLDNQVCEISGPNAAIFAGLKATEAECCVTVPCDVPLMKPKVLEVMFEAAGEGEVAVPMWPNGWLETLVMVLKRRGGLEIVETLCWLRRPRSDDIFRGAQTVQFISPTGALKAFDPQLESFVNINRQEDLGKLQTRPVHGTITQSFQAHLGPLMGSELQRLQEATQLCRQDKLPEAAGIFASVAKRLEEAHSFFWAAISRENQAGALLAYSAAQTEPQAAVDLDGEGRNAFTVAVADYCGEAELHLGNRCRFLAERAWADKAWCENWAAGNVRQIDRYQSKK